MPSHPDPSLHSFLVPTPPLDGLQEELLQKLEETRVALGEADAMLESTIAALSHSITSTSDDLVMQEGEEEPGVMMEKIEESEVQESRPLHGPLLWQGWQFVAAFIAYVVVGTLLCLPIWHLIFQLTGAHPI